jgi:6-phosphogluconolactonase (cycloisomerase 2 family)
MDGVLSMSMKGEFTVTDWQEVTEQELENGEKLNKASVTLTYTGSLEGNSFVVYAMHYANDGNATFVGLENISGKYQGEHCSITIKHDGEFVAGKATSDFVVIGSTTHPKLVNQRGQFESLEGGKSAYSLG